MLPDKEKLAFAYVVHRVSHGLTQKLTNILRHASVLSYSQFIVIAAIDHLERPNQSDIASFLNLSQTAVHGHIDFAVRRSYVSRADAYGYAPEMLLQITPKGKRMVEDMAATLEEELRAILPAGIKLSACTATLQAVNRQLPRRAAFPFDLL